VTKVREDGRGPFNKVLNKLLNFINQFLVRVKTQKEKLSKKLLETHPQSPVFKPSHLRKKLEDKKGK